MVLDICTQTHRFLRPFRPAMPRYSRLALQVLQHVVDASRQNASNQTGRLEDASTEESGLQNESKKQSYRSSDVSWRRVATGALAVALLATGGIGYGTDVFTKLTGSVSSGQFVVAATLRIGLVLGALWLAWDSLRRPARWLPPGLAAVGVVGIVVVAAQPRLIIAILPLVGGLMLFTSVLRVFRKD